MSDENELRDRIPERVPEPEQPITPDEPVEGEEPEPEPEPEPEEPSGPTVEEVTGKLGSAKLMPVERVVWCISHAAIHEDTTDPYGTATADTDYDDCSTEDHRPLYFRGRKGDPADMPEDARIIVASASDEPTLSDVEKAVLANLVQERYQKVESSRNEVRELFGEGYDVGAHDVLLSVLSSAHRNLRGEH